MVKRTKNNIKINILIDYANIDFSPSVKAFDIEENCFDNELTIQILDAIKEATERTLNNGTK